MTARKRKPKPVRAWATLSLLTGQINRCTDATRAECIDTCGFVGETDYKPVRVTIVPDGTPSPERQMLQRLNDTATRYLLYHASEPENPTRALLVKLVNEIDAALRGRRGAK